MPKVRKKYVLSEIPEGVTGGVPVRLGYVTVTESAFRFREDGKRRFLVRLKKKNAYEEIEIDADAYDLLVMALGSVREEVIRYATSRDGGRIWTIDESTVPTEGTYLEAKIAEGKLVIADQEVRFKNTGGVCFLNRNPSKGSAPEEGDVAISEAVFGFLWEAAEGKRIEKFRYEVPCDDNLNGGKLNWHVDRYLGPLAGTVIAEVVLKNSDIIGILPKKIAKVSIRNVTRDLRYKYEALAMNGVPES